MVHALTPGHGKTMVAAYLAGSRGPARHAFVLGATVTVAHTATVFALGIVTLTLSQFILPEQLYPWLNLASGVMVAGLGVFAIRERLRALAAGARDRGRHVPVGTVTHTTMGTITPPTTTATTTGARPLARAARRALVALARSRSASRAA